MKTAIIAPCHIQPSEAWTNELEKERIASGADVVIVDDSDGKLTFPSDWNVFDYEKQEYFLEDLYPEFAKLFHKCSACKAFGILYAYCKGYDNVIILDSDCIVSEKFVERHLRSLSATNGTGWQNTIGDTAFFARGFPYSMRNWKIGCNVGLWENVLDINGRDRSETEPKTLATKGFSFNSPAIVPLSGMNIALSRDAMLGFLFIPNTGDFKRIDDIWGGYIFQKLCQKLHIGLSFGEPFVHHDTVVDAKADEEEELAMYKYEDDFIRNVDEVVDRMPIVIGDYTTMEMMMDAFIAEFTEPHKADGIFLDFIPAFNLWRKAIAKYGK